MSSFRHNSAGQVAHSQCNRLAIAASGLSAAGSDGSHRADTIFNPSGVNHEHFRKNHERDFRDQGRRCARGRRRPRSAPVCGPSAAPAQTVDVAPILEKAAAAKKEKLNWRTSIVDLMKALDMDSSFGARKELAKELGYTGDTNDSAKMNIWLHKQVMTKLAANGGKLPPEIKH